MFHFLASEFTFFKEKAGWLPKKTVNQIVTLMKKKIPKLKEKKGDTTELDMDFEIELPTFTTVCSFVDF